jgi:hypothetical protein
MAAAGRGRRGLRQFRFAGSAQGRRRPGYGSFGRQDVMSTRYKDKLIEVSDEAVTFINYFPLFNRRVPLSRIERVNVAPPSDASVQWRLWGTSDGRTWFPLDWKRRTRDKIFVAFLRGSWGRIGFTVEDSRKVAGVFRDRGLLHETASG